MNTSIQAILDYNPQIPNQDFLKADTRINVPFSPCDCINGEYLTHVFNYTVDSNDTYDIIATEDFSNLTTAEWLQSWNSYSASNYIPNNAQLNVTVNCSCGDSSVSNEYGLFVTYPLRPGDNLSSVASDSGVTAKLLQEYNPNMNFNSGSGLVFIPGKDETGNYPALSTSSGPSGISSGAIAGISVSGVAVALLLAGSIYILVYKRKKAKGATFLHSESGQPINQERGGVPPRSTPITVAKSVEFRYKELAKATNNFNIGNKIGEGGFGAVYYAELRGEKAAIKKMDMKASNEFLAELKVLTHVHHLNLVRLIGYCVEGSLFLVYEFIENGNLSQHLRGSGDNSGNNLLSWSTRVQIALDSARGLEYIHEHTVPVYIHRDVKSANILIDKDYHGKVADFGLAQLTEVGNSLPTRLMGTFGYMPPEYAKFGGVSPKVDVFAFGVVLYELISAKEAVVKSAGNSSYAKGLVALFDDALSHPNPREALHKLFDPRLGDNYPLDSVLKMVELAEACTQEDPQLRPSMRSVVVALTTISSATEDWDVRSFYGNKALLNLMSGREQGPANDFVSPPGMNLDSSSLHGLACVV
ncbi:hypothetical protein NE237_002441 [Protea cynaroides]|uniref:non-specific serine/threonine protein kinase n=1 Tax=Protea cynaroides TaxID=273540 RepID=A0A9Q0QZ15_9MAGN|nr:hypothetical protein NE237_002441 [Protea cynaroides]